MDFSRNCVSQFLRADADIADVAIPPESHADDGQVVPLIRARAGELFVSSRGVS